MATSTSPPSTKPTILHLGDDIRWNHELYAELGRKFNIIRTYSMGRDEFKAALREKRWGDFVGMYRPFWNTGGEMGDWDEELIALLPPSLKIFTSAGAGYDWVNTQALARHGTIYCNSAAACTESVADAAILLLLSCYRAIPWSFSAARSCSATEFTHASQNIASVSHNPLGQTLGIVGLGRIGARIAEKATRGFGMRVWYYDVVRMREREEGLGVVWCESLGALLGGCDGLVLAAPFSGEVVLGRGEFEVMKRGLRLVNVARGKLVDEEALVEALDSGVVSAAGLDVHANEPHVDPRLARRDNVMVLSHTAGASVESHVGFERLGMENLLGWAEKGVEGCVSAVNLQWLERG
ncbi:NAD(P)-binding protein [Decorospora gaudefroyi]|uniref:NAD(P)-binding protein n=1 Tax=Decorospora gaudefroyi TaxID=184978 RepID=A0A6A5K4Y2_9PLEO|nr:NAD(P)-binding protein [Decorospora gaudefroyi]